MLEATDFTLALKANVPDNKQPDMPPAVPKVEGAQPVNDSELLTILNKTRGKDNKSCASCHTGASAKAGIVLFSSSGVLNPNAPWFKAWDAADEGRMPPEAKTNKDAAVSDQEMLALNERSAILCII